MSQSKKKREESQARTRAKIEYLNDWIKTMDERVKLLIDFDPSEDMSEADRETAASRHILAIGRYTELVQNFELQLLTDNEGEDDEDNPQNVHNLTFGEATPHNS